MYAYKTTLNESFLLLSLASYSHTAISLKCFRLSVSKKNQTDPIANNKWINKRTLTLMETRACKHVVLTWANDLSKALRIRTLVYISCLTLRIAFNDDSNKTGCAYNTRLYESSYSYRAWVTSGIEQSFCLSKTTKQLTFQIRQILTFFE